jgi:solute carrier family 12 sodium/potassium/chloride transporter 2
MYLREGWVVGNAGLLGAWLIILISFIITTTMGLSLSSITTNIRIGAGGAFFKPSVIFLRLPETSERDEVIKKVIQKARESRLGVLLFADHPKASLGRRKLINLWIEDRSPNWEIAMELGNMDLAILIAYKLKRNWKASLNLITFVKKKHYVEAAHEYLTNLIELAGIPNAQVYVVLGGLESDIAETHLSSLNIFSLQSEPDLDFVRQMVNQTQSACLFALDSGDENALV